MRKVIVSNFTSLDGYVAGVGNDVMALPFDPSFDVYNLERVRNADTLLTGRTTYEQLMAFWVPFADDPAASDLQREIGRFNRDVEKLVISDSLRADATPVAAQRWSDATKRSVTSRHFGRHRDETSSASAVTSPGTRSSRPGRSMSCI